MFVTASAAKIFFFIYFRNIFKFQTFFSFPFPRDEKKLIYGILRILKQCSYASVFLLVRGRVIVMWSQNAWVTPGHSETENSSGSVLQGCRRTGSLGTWPYSWLINQVSTCRAESFISGRMQSPCTPLFLCFTLKSLLK